MCAMHLLAQLARGGDEHRRRLRAVLRLREQVDRGQERVGLVVRDDEDLGGAGEEIDPDLAEELTLGLGHVRVARAGDEVDRIDRLGADRHGGDRLNPAEDIDLIGPRELHRRHGRGGDLAADRRRARHDARHPGDLGRDDRHVRRGGQRVLSAGDVGARGLNGDVLLAEEHPGQRLDLDVDERVPLRLRERAHLLLHEHDVVDDLLVEGRHDLCDAGVVESEGLGAPLVELLRVLPYGRVAVVADVVDDRIHSLSDIALGAVGERFRRRALQVQGHRCFLSAQRLCIRMLPLCFRMHARSRVR